MKCGILLTLLHSRRKDGMHADPSFVSFVPSHPMSFIL
jgi:hypothetical protein